MFFHIVSKWCLRSFVKGHAVKRMISSFPSFIAPPCHWPCATSGAGITSTGANLPKRGTSNLKLIQKMPFWEKGQENCWGALSPPESCILYHTHERSSTKLEKYPNGGQFSRTGVLYLSSTRRQPCNVLIATRAQTRKAKLLEKIISSLLG